MLSPANLAGVRGGRIVSGESRAGFMATLLEGGAVPLGDVYEFISSLYYRGKRGYAVRFGHRPGGGPAVWVVTPTAGLVPDDRPVTLVDLRGFARGDIDPESAAYLDPLTRSARALAQELGPRAEIVLLGSIASGKYLDPLAEVFGEGLLFPASFAGRGDMSRGGLLLRAVSAGEELDYVVAVEAERRGRRPPRLG